MAARRDNCFRVDIRPKLSYYKQVLRLRLPKYRQALNAVVDALNRHRFTTTIDKINYVRHWVNANSVHLIDDEHDSYAFDVPVVIYLLNRSGKQQRGKPHLSCGPRSYAMKEILKGLGLESRIIDIFGFSDEVPPRVNPHTLLEVFDKDNGRWSLQDPDFNVAYLDRHDKQYVSAERALQLGRKGLDYTANGNSIENALNLNNTLERLFEHIVLYRFSYEGRRSSLVVKDKVDAVLGLKVAGIGEGLSFKEFLVNRDATLGPALGHSLFKKRKGRLCL